MAKYGINPEFALGIKIPVLRNLAGEIGTNHTLSLRLWDTKYHEGRILATMIAGKKETTPELCEKWMKDFNSWDLCDQACMNLFEKLSFAWEKVPEWCQLEPEIEKRTGFVMIARLAVSDKKSPDDRFFPFFPLLLEGSVDERNFVKKAVNWAIRQVGKRSLVLNKEMTVICRQLLKTESKPSKWIASDALRELEGAAVQNMLQKKEMKKKTT